MALRVALLVTLGPMLGVAMQLKQPCHPLAADMRLAVAKEEPHLPELVILSSWSYKVSLF